MASLRKPVLGILWIFPGVSDIDASFARRSVDDVTFCESRSSAINASNRDASIGSSQSGETVVQRSRAGSELGLDSNFVDSSSPHFPVQGFSVNDSFGFSGDNAKQMFDQAEREFQATRGLPAGADISLVSRSGLVRNLNLRLGQRGRYENSTSGENYSFFRLNLIGDFLVWTFLVAPKRENAVSARLIVVKRPRVQIPHKVGFSLFDFRIL